jgi:hypothetical protein
MLVPFVYEDLWKGSTLDGRSPHGIRHPFHRFCSPVR